MFYGISVLEGMSGKDFSGVSVLSPCRITSYTQHTQLSNRLYCKLSQKDNEK